MTASFSLRTLSRADILENLSPLSDILAGCVNGGASVSFMLPFSWQTAQAFWLRIAESVAAGERLVVVAEHAGQIVGTVQLVIDQAENQPHRADVAKLLVHQNARRQGLAKALMNHRTACPRAGEVCSGTGYGHRQWRGTLLCPVWLGKSRGNSALCVNAGWNDDRDLTVL